MRVFRTALWVVLLIVLATFITCYMAVANVGLSPPLGDAGSMNSVSALFVLAAFTICAAGTAIHVMVSDSRRQQQGVVLATNYRKLSLRWTSAVVFLFLLVCAVILASNAPPYIVALAIGVFAVFSLYSVYSTGYLTAERTEARFAGPVGIISRSKFLTDRYFGTSPVARLTKPAPT